MEHKSFNIQQNEIKAASKVFFLHSFIDKYDDYSLQQSSSKRPVGKLFTKFHLRSVT